METKKKRIFSKEHIEKLKKAAGHMRGKTYEEAYGKEKAEILKQKHREAKLGSKCEFWRGGTSLLQRPKHQNSVYAKWRKSVFERDKYTCQECRIKFIKGFTGSVELNADHIKPFALIVRENNIKTMEQALNCKELWDINNGRTLCIPCHKKTDTWGYNYNNWMDLQRNEKGQFVKIQQRP